MPRPTPRSIRAERDRLAAYHALAGTMRGLEEDLRWGLNDSLGLPREWLRIARDPAVPGKEKVTVRLDEDVLRFFRAMGAGHLTRINAVLIPAARDVDSQGFPERRLSDSLRRNRGGW